jgi:hypothetical protein
MITYPKIVGIVAAAFVAGSFVASPELRAYAANTVFSADIVDGQVMTVDLANNAVTAAKVKDGEIKAPEIATNAVGASEIATDAVGAAELAGVTKLLFGECTRDFSSTNLPGGNYVDVECNIIGVANEDSAVATLNVNPTGCFDTSSANADTGNVDVRIRNECSTVQSPGVVKIGIIVFDR